MSRMNTAHVAGFGLASVGCAEDDDSLCWLVHWKGMWRRGGEGEGRLD